MKMSKYKYKQGTKVRITNPEFFVRCALLSDAAETIKELKTEVENLEKRFL